MSEKYKSLTVQLKNGYSMMFDWHTPGQASIILKKSGAVVQVYPDGMAIFDVTATGLGNIADAARRAYNDQKDMTRKPVKKAK